VSMPKQTYVHKSLNMKASQGATLVCTDLITATDSCVLKASSFQPCHFATHMQLCVSGTTPFPLMHRHAYTHTYANAHAHTYANAHAHKHANAHAHKHANAHAHTYAQADSQSLDFACAVFDEYLRTVHELFPLSTHIHTRLSVNLACLPARVAQELQQQQKGMSRRRNQLRPACLLFKSQEIEKRK
jgi:hypothetical protein